MPTGQLRCLKAAALVAIGVCLASSGCQLSINFGGSGPGAGPGPGANANTEGHKAAIPAYIVEPPDLINVQVLRALPDRPFPTTPLLVRPDGTIDMGLYGIVRVAGLTLDDIKTRIAEHLQNTFGLKNPTVAVDVYAYNSKFFYVLSDGAGFGESGVRQPFTGNETVLDAITNIGGLPPVSHKCKIWVARPGCGVMPVNWIAVTQCADMSTNYQLLPGDRIYIDSDPLLKFDSMVAKIINPWERIFGFTLLGAETVKRLQNMGRGGGTGGT